MDGTPAGLEAEASISRQVPSAPGLGPGLHPRILPVPVLTAQGPARWQAAFVGLEHLPGHIPGKRLGKGQALQPGEGPQRADAGLQLIHPGVVLAARQTVLQTGEEDHDLPGRHGGARGDQLMAPVPGIQIQQPVLPAEHLARLVQAAHLNAHIVLFRVQRRLDQLLRREADAVYPAEGRDKGDGHRRRGAQSPDGKRPLEHAAEAHGEALPLLQRPDRAAQIVGPIPLPGRHRLHKPLGPLGKLQGAELHHAVELGAVGQADAPVDGKARDLAQVVVRVRPDGTDPVRRERDFLRLAAVDLPKSFFSVQRRYPPVFAFSAHDSTSAPPAQGFPRE